MLARNVAVKMMRPSGGCVRCVGKIVSRSMSDTMAPSDYGKGSSVDQGTGVTPNLPGLSPDQIRKIGETDTALRSQHLKIEGTMDAEEKDVARRKRMIYRSKQRGWLEADLLLGSWAVSNVPGLNADELDQYEEILKVETIDIYNYISLKDVPPDHLKDLSLMKRLQTFALRRDMVAPEGYAAVKKNANLT